MMTEARAREIADKWMKPLSIDPQKAPWVRAAIEGAIFEGCTEALQQVGSAWSQVIGVHLAALKRASESPQDRRSPSDDPSHQDNPNFPLASSEPTE